MSFNKISLFLLLTVFLFVSTLLFGQEVKATGNSIPLYKAIVLEAVNEGERQFVGIDQDFESFYQTVRVRMIEGDDEGKEITINHGETLSVRENQKVKKGMTIILTKMENPEGKLEYFIVDKYRLDFIGYIFAGFLVLVVLLSQLKGVGSIAGMFISFAVIVKYIVPNILAGRDPLLTSIIGSIFILITSIYMAHGFSKQTTIAVISTTITLIITGILSVIFVNLGHLSGLGQEDAMSLQFGSTSNINFKGLLLGGMIIGFLGVLDDITTGLSATVFELKKANPKFTFSELTKRALNVGREHISSLVNTLVLAYAGVPLPLFLFIILNPQGYPLWFIINSELISEEIIRTLVGSTGLLLAVPITTLFAAWTNTSREK